MENQTLTAEEVAAYLNCDYKVVCNLAKRGQLPAAKVGRAWVFRSSDVESFLARVIEAQTEQRKGELNEVQKMWRAHLDMLMPKRRGGRPRKPLPTLPFGIEEKS